jgi:hypothetical protein
MIQCARIAFGFVGIYDDDEAARIVDATVVEEVRPATAAARTAAAAAAAKAATKRIAAPKPKPEASPREAALESLRGEIADAGTVEQLEDARKRAYGFHDDGLFGDGDLTVLKEAVRQKLDSMTTPDGEILETVAACAGAGGDA